jgi:hypothetical protein
MVDMVPEIMLVAVLQRNDFQEMFSLPTLAEKTRKKAFGALRHAAFLEETFPLFVCLTLNFFDYLRVFRREQVPEASLRLQIFLHRLLLLWRQCYDFAGR